MKSHGGRRGATVVECALMLVLCSGAAAGAYKHLGAKARECARKATIAIESGRATESDRLESELGQPTKR